VDLIELEVLAGLRPFCERELARRMGAAATVHGGDDTSVLIELDPAAGLGRLLELKTVVAAYLVRRFLIPRPRGLLGEEHLRSLLDQIDRVRALHPAAAFESFRLGAAGADSAVFNRLAGELAARTDLEHRPRDGDMLLRFRPAAGAGGGWEVLARISPRPLSARGWRRRDLPGALNATIAASLVELTDPAPEDRFLNLLCGSGTLLIERLLRSPAALAVGIDIESAVLAMTRDNLAGAGLQAPLVRADGTSLGISDRAFDAIVADLPYGARSGSHAGNPRLYSELLREAARVSLPGGRLAVITHDIRRFETALAASPRWRPQTSLRVFQKGLRPTAWLLRRE
jgi:SAM-dependent methyltransferase